MPKLNLWKHIFFGLVLLLSTPHRGPAQTPGWPAADEAKSSPARTATSSEAPPAPHFSETTVLVTAADVRALRAAPATPITSPVTLKGVVTFVHAERQTFYLTDSTGSVAVSLADERLALPLVGDLVSLTGTALPGSRVPVVRANSIIVERKVVLPDAEEISYDDALSGNEEAQWVEIQGQLRQVDVLDGWVRLAIVTPSGEFSVSTPSPERPLATLGATLRVRGICSAWMVGRTQKIGGFFLFSPSLSNIEVVKTSTSDTPVLSQVNQVQRLRAEEAKSGRAVQLRGVVTFTHPDQRIFYINDATGGILVWIDDTTSSLVAGKTPESATLPSVGSFVTVRGHTTSGVFSASVHADEIETRGSRPLPAPRAISLEQALTGSEDGQWVEMRGHLRQIDVFGSWLRLTLTATVGDFLVSIPRAAGTNFKIGSFLRVRGVCQPWLNEKSRVGGVFLYTPSLNDVEVAEAALSDPFAAPEEAISNLQQYRTQTLQQQQVMVRGVVLHYVSGRYVVVENASGVVRALSRNGFALIPGDQVDVVGFPGRQGNRSVLRGAVYRKTASGSPPAPLNLPQDLKVDPALEGHLVTAKGSLVNLAWRPEDTRLMVQVGNAVIEVVYQGALPSSVPEQWETGSEITVSGLYWVEHDDNDQPSKFSLQLRSPADLVIRKTPSWWTAQRALTGLGLFAVCLVLGLVWATALHRQVRQQTDVIRTQLEKEANLQARHGEIIEHASDFIFTTDMSGRFTSFNPAGERSTGYTREEALKIGIPDLIASEDSAIAGALLALVSQPEHTQAARFEMRFRTRDGRLVWMETSARPIQEAGRPVGLLGIARDITERKQIEDELRRARIAAEATTQAKSAFLANMSHEIRTPLSGVIGMSNLLLDTPLQNEQREFAETIHNSAQSLLTILNDILDFSKIEAGKLEFEHTPFDLATPIEDSLGLLATRAQAKGIQLIADIPPDLPRQVIGDPGRLRQVLMNLLGNAVKFTERGEVTVAVGREEETSSHIQLHFEISDTGVGMKEETLQQLFRPFSQADASTTRRFGGTGLGLAISKQLVTLMGGRVGVQSQPGHGSTFWFTVRLEKQPGAKAAADLAPLNSIAGARVLVIGDHATNLKIVSQNLEAWKIRFEIAKSTQEALEKGAAASQGEGPFRAVIIDNDLSETDGLSVAKNLRPHSAFLDLPLVLLTSLGRRVTRQDLPALGVRHVLRKPVRQDDLKRTLLRVLNGDKDTRPNSQFTTPKPPESATEALPHLRVAVAEDNLVNQRIIDMQLKKLGVVADMSNSGHELLAALENKPYDLVLMDCQMPEMDGYEATRRVRASNRFPDVRIVAMTANAMQGDREKCLAAGMDDYITKPVRIEELRRVLGLAKV
ncbi:MAG: response regulator [Nibricoccus sp.]